MTLCFGIFAGILNCCKRELSQEKFVPRIAWVLDRRNRSLKSESKEDRDEDKGSAVDNPDNTEGNKSVVSRLLSCKRPLVLRENQLPSLEVARERFKSQVMPFINEDMVAKAVSAVLYIISKDETIEAEHKESFRRYLGMYKEELLQQTSFDVPDVLTRVLLYTTCVDNKEGQPYVKKITDTFIEEATNDNWAELKWDTITQTLELIPAKEKLLSDRVDQLCQLRSPITADKYLSTEWIWVNMTDLDPSIWGRTEIRESDAQRLLSRKINPYAQTKSPESLVSPLKPKPAQANNKQEDT